MPTVPDNDPRWGYFLGKVWSCPTCKQEHVGLPELACGWPDPWEGDKAPEPNAKVRDATNILTEDFCVLNGEHYFVRCVLLLPLVGTSGQAGYGVWSTLSKKNFDIYLDQFDLHEPQERGPWFGWFSNRLKGYLDTFGLKCQVHPQASRQRPLIELEHTDHPLAVEQRHGVSLDRVLNLHELNGHDIRRILLN